MASALSASVGGGRWAPRSFRCVHCLRCCRCCLGGRRGPWSTACSGPVGAIVARVRVVCMSVCRASDTSPLPAGKSLWALPKPFHHLRRIGGWGVPRVPPGLRAARSPAVPRGARAAVHLPQGTDARAGALAHSGVVGHDAALSNSARICIACNPAAAGPSQLWADAASSAHGGSGRVPITDCLTGRGSSPTRTPRRRPGGPAFQSGLSD